MTTNQLNFIYDMVCDLGYRDDYLDATYTRLGARPHEFGLPVREWLRDRSSQVARMLITHLKHELAVRLRAAPKAGSTATRLVSNNRASAR